MILAQAHANLALVKYWGKTAEGGNRAANASLSVTLDGLTSLAAVRFRSRGESDRAVWHPPGPTEGLGRFVAHAREVLRIRRAVDVVVQSDFPVGSGLASSASAYAALTYALAEAADEAPGNVDLTALARSGSGSACRSLLGGFVEWQVGAEETVRQVAAADHWPLAVVIAVTREEPKHISSREGMVRTASTSPFYRAWLDANPADLSLVRDAVQRRDLAALGPVVERNALRMHATALGSTPPLLYWEPATVAVMREVWRLREEGTAAFFSIDAGPQVKVVCEPGAADGVAAALTEVPGVHRVLRSRPGQGPRVLREPPSWARLPAPWQDTPTPAGGGAT
ncbi:diphosphomevalonate decarboxylase [Kitasatospora sp. MBT63]|uniref:diphosphomevalonate decarboxylase n=1 Tax=Kitasatospora sp. MBT63 TaxID=1444768 RepID=UPI000691ABA6|nr:diphosphomevalonate decarboxylase [Kitasatospora sp. MBT63]